MTIYVEKSMEPTKKKLLRLISEFSKGVGYNTHIEKPATSLYSRNEQLDSEIKNQCHLQ